MLSIYTSLKCKKCRKEFILPTEDLKSMPTGKYIACPYCGSRHVIKESETDDLRECMSERSYRRVKGGAIRQVRDK